MGNPGPLAAIRLIPTRYGHIVAASARIADSANVATDALDCNALSRNRVIIEGPGLASRQPRIIPITPMMITTIPSPMNTRVAIGPWRVSRYVSFSFVDNESTTLHKTRYIQA